MHSEANIHSFAACAPLEPFISQLVFAIYTRECCVLAFANPERAPLSAHAASSSILSRGVITFLILWISAVWGIVIAIVQPARAQPAHFWAYQKPAGCDSIIPLLIGFHAQRCRSTPSRSLAHNLFAPRAPNVLRCISSAYKASLSAEPALFAALNWDIGGLHVKW